MGSEVRVVRAEPLDIGVDRVGPVSLGAERATHDLGAILASAKKTALLTGATLVSVNVWTGAPLFALWVGSRVVVTPGLTMGAFWLILLVLAVVEVLLTLALTWLNATYDELTNRPMEARRTSPWLRSMRGEREDVRRIRVRPSPIERATMLSVVTAVFTFEIWFFFFAHPVLAQTSAGGL